MLRRTYVPVFILLRNCRTRSEDVGRFPQVAAYLPVSNLKHQFNVSNAYVLQKLRLVLFPWRHRPWSRQVRRSDTTGQNEGYKPPREDINSPDLYIPCKFQTIGLKGGRWLIVPRKQLWQSLLIFYSPHYTRAYKSVSIQSYWASLLRKPLESY